VWLFLSKLLPVFVYPLGLSILLCAVALAFSARGHLRVGRVLVLLALIVLWLASAPVVSNWLYSRLEARFPPTPTDQSPSADVAIVLGGSIKQSLPPRVSSDMSDAADRVLHAARLFREGRVKHILVSGGNLPWETTNVSEALLVADLLVEFGVPSTAIVMETDSRNTYENAVNSAGIMTSHGWRSVLLVTSAAHMPRALAVFRRAGVEAIPSATDVRVNYPFYDSVLDFLPDAEALARTTEALKEYIGLFVYRMRGWA
jgi:uncharacterized SAM-binding protein YcdF (DUF218 family)